MPTVPARDFVRDFPRYRGEAEREVVKVMSNGQVIGAYLSAKDLQRFERLIELIEENGTTRSTGTGSDMDNPAEAAGVPDLACEPAKGSARAVLALLAQPHVRDAPPGDASRMERVNQENRQAWGIDGVSLF